MRAAVIEMDISAAAADAGMMEEFAKDAPRRLTYEFHIMVYFEAVAMEARWHGCGVGEIGDECRRSYFKAMCSKRSINNGNGLGCGSSKPIQEGDQ